MEDTIKLTAANAKQIFYALDQALPELEELCHQGDIKESIPEAVERALHIMREAIS